MNPNPAPQGEPPVRTYAIIGGILLVLALVLGIGYGKLTDQSVRTTPASTDRPFPGESPTMGPRP